MDRGLVFVGCCVFSIVMLTAGLLVFQMAKGAY